MPLANGGMTETERMLLPPGHVAPRMVPAPGMKVAPPAYCRKAPQFRPADSVDKQTPPVEPARSYTGRKRGRKLGSKNKPKAVESAVPDAM